MNTKLPPQKMATLKSRMSAMTAMRREVCVIVAGEAIAAILADARERREWEQGGARGGPLTRFRSAPLSLLPWFAGVGVAQPARDAAAQLGGERVRTQSLLARDRRDQRGQRAGALGVDLDDTDAAHEGVDRQALAEARRAAGGQHVVGARDVVGKGRRGVTAEKDRPGAADLLQHLAGIGDVQLEVLGAEGVRELHRGLYRAAIDDRDVVDADLQPLREAQDLALQPVAQVTVQGEHGAHRSGAVPGLRPVSYTHPLPP